MIRGKPFCVVLLGSLSLFPTQLRAIGMESSVVELKLENNFGQTIHGWGFSPSPIDWDGNCMLRSSLVQEKLYSEANVKIVRILIGASDIYDDEKKVIKTANALILVKTQLEVFRTHESLKYMISILTPPPTMKSFVSAEGHVDLVDNGLRPERESDFAMLVAEFLTLVRAQGLPLPVALSIQARPDATNYSYGCPPTTAQGCPYSIEQYTRICLKVRQALAAVGINSVRLIGPETSGDWHEELPFTNEKQTMYSGLDSFLFVAPNLARPQGHLASLIGSIPVHDEGRESIWILSRLSPSMVTEQQRLVSVFKNLGRDLILFRANYWIWQYCFTWEQSSESLFWGRNYQISPVGKALETFWQQVPKGARIQTMACPNRQIKLHDPNGVDAFALSIAQDVVVVVVNDDDQDRTYSIQPLTSLEVKIFSCEKEFDKPFEVRASKAGSVASISIPAKSVAIVVGKLRSL